MTLSVQFLSQAIVGLPGTTVSQATTDTSAAFSAGAIAAGKMYLLNSDKVCHLKFGSSGSGPTAVPATSMRLPPNQFLAVSTDEDVDLAIIRGADETANGTLWACNLLETAAKL
jgi:hypothetical protein